MDASLSNALVVRKQVFYCLAGNHFYFYCMEIVKGSCSFSGTHCTKSVQYYGMFIYKCLVYSVLLGGIIF